MANIITLSRFPLIFIYLGVLYYGSPQTLFWNIPFILLIIGLDGLDGIIARTRNETSLVGSVLDIAADRTLEYLLWVVFAHLQVIPVLVPVIVLTRGTLVDAIRSLGMKKGVSPFAQIKRPVNQFLVSSRWMRFSYGAAKASAFALLTLTWALQRTGQSGNFPAAALAGMFTWMSVALCILRGLPVLLEGFSSLRSDALSAKKSRSA